MFAYRGRSLIEYATSADPEFGSSSPCSFTGTVRVKSVRSRRFDCIRNNRQVCFMTQNSQPENRHAVLHGAKEDDE